MGLPAAKAGLAERRVLKDFESSQLPELVAQIQKAARYNIEVEVDWEAMYHQDAHPDYWSPNMTKVYFEPTVTALESICSDEMGREALQSKVTKVRFTNVCGKSSGDYSIEGDTLVFDHRPDANVDYGKDRVKALVKFLESSL